MPSARAHRLWLVLGFQLSVLGMGLAATYDRGPLPAATSWLVGRDREAEARAAAGARAAEVAQRTPENAVQGADGETRYAVVRSRPPRAESAWLVRTRREMRTTFIVIAVLAVASSLVRLRRERGERRKPPELLGVPPEDAFGPRWPAPDHADPLASPIERGDSRGATAGRPRR
jgi:hypothetical protein